jgi:Holliday junction resolvasome RuvABC ATP-dependent DNA helicase subunit
MKSFQLQLIIEDGTPEQVVNIDLPRFTLVAATPDDSQMSTDFTRLFSVQVHSSPRTHAEP